MKKTGQTMCTHCDKIIHANQHAAMRAVAAGQKQHRIGKIRPYRCPHGYWHITKIMTEVPSRFKTREFWVGRRGFSHGEEV